MDEQARILVVDDEEGMCEFLRYLLEGEGYGVELAHSATEALTKIEQEPFHLVLTDIKMPGMDGLEMLQRIKEADEKVVVIIMTAYSSLDNAIRAIKYDAFNYLIKPFDDPDVVLAAIAEGLKERDSVPEG
jgi:DNA-binding NtrC family response regulator